MEYFFPEPGLRSEIEGKLSTAIIAGHSEGKAKTSHLCETMLKTCTEYPERGMMYRMFQEACLN